MTQSCERLKWTNDDGEEPARSTLFLRCGRLILINMKAKYYKDRRGLEQEEVVALLFELTPWDIASIALVF